MRVNNQQNSIDELDKNIHKMEKIEKEMLDRLKNSQALEQDAYKNLEDAIKQSENSYQTRLNAFQNEMETNKTNRKSRIQKTEPQSRSRSNMKHK